MRKLTTNERLSTLRAGPQALVPTEIVDKVTTGRSRMANVVTTAIEGLKYEYQTGYPCPDIMRMISWSRLGWRRRW